MHFIYWFCEGNEYQAAEEYKRIYPIHRGPDICVFGRVHRYLRETFPKHTAEHQSTLNKQDGYCRTKPLYKCSTNIKSDGISRMKVWMTLYEN